MKRQDHSSLSVDEDVMCGAHFQKDYCRQRCRIFFAQITVSKTFLRRIYSGIHSKISDKKKQEIKKNYFNRILFLFNICIETR